MPHAVWKGRIQFGPVDVPVKLYSAIEDMDVHSHLLHDQDNARMEQRMVCSEDGEVVPNEEIAKGYEVTSDEFIVIEPDELDFLEPQASRRIDVMEFVNIRQVDERYLDRTYYLGPDNDDQLYVNLMQSLKTAKQAGMCQWVMRKKSYLGVLKYGKDILTLTTHRYPDEVVALDSFEIEDVNIAEKEIKIAKNLIGELEDEFRPEKYTDEYQAKLQKLIEEKAKGKKIELPALEEVRETKDKELLTMLEKSLKSLKKAAKT